MWRKSNKRKKKEVPYSSQYHDELDGEEPVVYEEVPGDHPNYCQFIPVVIKGKNLIVMNIAMFYNVSRRVFIQYIFHNIPVYL